MIRLGFKMILRDKKSSLFYLLAMFIGVMVTFTFTTIATDKTVTNSLGELVNDSTSRVPMNEYLALIVVAFCCILVFYVNNYFVISKKDEIAGLLTYGATTYDVIVYFLTQTAFLFLIASIPAFLCGYVTLDIVYKWIDSILGTHNHILSAQSFGFTIALLITIYVYLIMYIVLHISKLEVKDILYGDRKSENTKPNKLVTAFTNIFKGKDANQVAEEALSYQPKAAPQTQSFKRDLPKQPISFKQSSIFEDTDEYTTKKVQKAVSIQTDNPAYKDFMVKTEDEKKVDANRKPKEKKISLGASLKIYVAFYVVGIVLIPFMKDNTLMMIAFLVAFYGVYGLVRRGIPALIKYLKEKNMYKDRFSLVYLSNLKNTIRRSIIIMVLLILSVSVVFYLCLRYRDNIHEMVICIIGYFVVVILLSVCVMFFELIESKQRSLIYSNMWKVGYTKKELVTIMRKEMIFYYGSFVILPTIICISLSIRFIALDASYITISAGLLIYYLGILFITGIIAYVVYKRTILSTIVRER